MSSSQNQNSSPSNKVGWISGLSLAVAYSLFFSLISGALFSIAYFSMADAIRDSEQETVRNRAAEYRAWFLNGEIEMLAARMDEQSLGSGDIMFVRITGPRVDYIKAYSPDGSTISPQEIRSLKPGSEGTKIELGGEEWVVASLPLHRQNMVLQAGKNSRASDVTLARLRRIFTLTFVPAVLVAAFGGAWLTYRRLSPIRSLIHGMRQIITSGNLSQRIEPTKNRNEFNELVDVFNRLLASNQSLISAMHDSLDNVAHDFRTPLSRINITAQEALSHESNPEKLRSALADCVEETEQLSILLTTLMDVAEAESGAMKLELVPCSLSKLVNDVVELYEFVAEEKHIKIKTDLPEEIVLSADRTRFKRALANLLDNAIKYSLAGGMVTISVRKENNHTHLRFTDEGLGIAEGDLPHIWDRLYRADRSRSAKGMGLGLSFVKAITEAHHGEVHVKSQLGKGSIFSIILPT